MPLISLLHSSLSRDITQLAIEKKGNKLQRGLHTSFCPRKNTKLTLLYPQALYRPQQNHHKVIKFNRRALLILISYALISLKLFSKETETSSKNLQPAPTSYSMAILNSQLKEAQAAAYHKDYKKSFFLYKKLLNDSQNKILIKTNFYKKILLEFSKISVELTKRYISQSQYTLAQQTIDSVIQEPFSSKYPPALHLANKLSSTKEGNISAFSQKQNTVFINKLFKEAELAYQEGNLNDSFNKYQKILTEDSNNKKARLGMELIDRKKEENSAITANEERYNMINNTDKEWELPIYQETINKEPEKDHFLKEENNIISKKIEKIIIPNIDFFELPITEAINQIKKKAFLLDTSESNPNKKGINIVLQINSISSINEKKITLSLTDLPLKEVLNYIALQADLVLRIEPYALVLIPKKEFQEQLVIKEYTVPSNIIDSFFSFSTTQNLKHSFQGTKEEFLPKEFLISQGVTFPAGSFVYYLPSTNKLIIKNTPSNLDLISALLVSSSEEKIGQVEIETRFLEVKQNNLKEHGLDWLMGSLEFSAKGGINNNDIPQKTSSPSPNKNLLTALPESGTFLGVSPASKEVLALAGILTNPQFQVLLKALNQQKGVNLLSAPKVTVSSGRRAMINISRELPYPGDYTPPQIPQSQGSGINPAIPATPSSFKKRNIGVQLEVRPFIREENKSVELQLYPQLVEFKGFVNYGTPIYSQAPVFFAGQTNTVFSTQQVLLTQNIINQPIFSVSQVTTDVILQDGQTVVLGGLMREDIQKICNKIPILESLPFFGGLFRSYSEQKTKQNLIIFVTVHLIQ